MGAIVTAGAIMLGVTSFFGVVLAVANRYMRVDEDPRIDRVEEMLPGSNCGACGQPGCRGFAEAVLAGAARPSACTVSSSEGIESIALFLGIDAGSQDKVVARLHCAGGRSSVRQIADYDGPRSCRAAFVVGGGGRACPWGCLGYADCERACGFGAIRMNDENLPVVDVDLCTACNDCVDICPLDLFVLERLAEPLIVQCSAPLAGETARAACRVACDACGRCALDAPEGAIVMEGNLPVIQDPARTGPECTYRCPTGAIRWVTGDQFEPETAPARTEGALHV